MSDTPRTDAKHMSPDKAVCKTCNDTGFIVSRSPTTGDEQRYQCNHDGTIFVPLPAASQNLWVCKARRSSGPERGSTTISAKASTRSFVTAARSIYPTASSSGTSTSSDAKLRTAGMSARRTNDRQRKRRVARLPQPR
jgi:hypothetical protein